MRVLRLAAVAAALLPALLVAGCSSGPSPDGRVAPSAAPSARPSASPTVPAAPTLRPVARLAAIGDSLSRGFDACSHYGDCPAASWSTGTDTRVDSIASRIATATGRRPAVFAAAHSGTDSSDLARQVDATVAERPDVVTVLMGANDACRASVDGMTPVAEYDSRVRDALARLGAALPDARVLVASIPDVTALLPAAAHDPTARFVWSRLAACEAALADPLSAAAPALARRAAVRDRIREYDRVLQDACAAVPRCVFDGGAVTGRRPTLADLSPLDYFHPSVAGLHELAETEWRALEPMLRR